MSSQPITGSKEDDFLHHVASQLHSVAINTLRRARVSDRKNRLTPERLSILSILSVSGPRTISELAAIEMVSLPAITRIVNFLEKLGYVARDRNSDDGRVVRVTATQQGLDLMDEERRRRVEHVADELSKLNDLQLMVVAEALELLERNRDQGR